MSAYLYGAKSGSRRELFRFLVTRGAWLVFVELTIVSFAWNFNIGPQSVTILQVIWAIGASMIVLALLIWLPLPAIAGVGLAMVLGHNLLDLGGHIDCS